MLVTSVAPLLRVRERTNDAGAGAEQKGGEHGPLL